MPHPRSRALAAALLLVALVPREARAQEDGLTYDVRVTVQGTAALPVAPMLGGRYHVQGDRARFEPEPGAPNGPLGPGRVMLMLDGGTRTVVLDTVRRTWFAMDMGAMAGGIAATNAANGITMTMKDVSTSLDSLGAGDVLLGEPTTRWRMTTRFRLAFGVGETAMEMATTSETTISFGQSSHPPLLGARAQSAAVLGLAFGVGAEELARTAALAARLPARVPLRTEQRLTMEMPGGTTMTQQTTSEVVGLRRARLPDALFAIPDGYREVPVGAR